MEEGTATSRVIDPSCARHHPAEQVVFQDTVRAAIRLTEVRSA